MNDDRVAALGVLLSVIMLTFGGSDLSKLNSMSREEMVNCFNSTTNAINMHGRDDTSDIDKNEMESRTRLNNITLILFDTLMNSMLSGIQLKRGRRRKQNPVLVRNRRLGPILRTHAKVIPDQSPVVRRRIIVH